MRPRSAEPFSPPTGSYLRGRRAKKNPPFESEVFVWAIAPLPTGTARIVTGRFTSADPFNRTVPCTGTGIGSNAIGTVVSRSAGCDAGITRVAYPAADTEPA